MKSIAATALSLSMAAASVSAQERGTSLTVTPAGTTAMTHIAINEALDGKAVDWLEPVSEVQYAGK